MKQLNENTGSANTEFAQAASGSSPRLSDSPESNAAIENLTTAERQEKLFRIQARLQRIWDRIEYREIVGAPWAGPDDMIAAELWRQFEAAEAEEKLYLRPGFPIVQAGGDGAVGTRHP